MSASNGGIPPIERSTIVSWDQTAAFKRFTEGFADWWPASSHSIGGSRVKRVVFEGQVGGRIFEEHKDGRRYEWGVVTEWDAPRRVAFTWRPSKQDHEAQNVEVTFSPERGGTRVVLISTGWEKFGARAHRERMGYSIGWASILDVFAGRRTVAGLAFAAISHTITFVLRATGRLDAEIDKAPGRFLKE